MNLVKSSLCLLLLTLGIPAVAQVYNPKGNSSTKAQARLELISSGTSQVVVSVSGLRPSVTTVNSRTIISHSLHQYNFQRDTARIPGLSFTIGIPQGANNIQASVQNRTSATTTLPNGVSLHPTLGGQAATALGTPVVIRGLTTVTVFYAPLRLVGTTLEYDESATIAVTWEGGMAGAIGGYKEIPTVEQALAGHIINFQQAKGWRRRTTPVIRDFAKQTATGTLGVDGGYGIGEALVMLTPREGIYRVTAADIRNSSVNVDLPVPDIRIHNRNNSVPYYLADGNIPGVFDGDDFIEFMGKRTPGEPGIYLSEITDTNAYVFSWDGRGNDPAAVLTGISGSGNGAVLASYDSTLHFEKDLHYFNGLRLIPSNGGDITTVHVTERVPHERYYWSKVSNTVKDPLEFVCSPYFGQGGMVKLSVRLSGFTYNTSTQVFHTINTRLNGIDLGQISVRDTADTTIQYNIPAHYLVNGTNRLTMTLQENPGAFPGGEDLWVDYVELNGEWRPTAWGTPASFRIPTGTSGPVRARIAGFTTPPASALHGTSRTAIDSVTRGLLFRLASRNFDAGSRVNPSVYGEFGDTSFASPSFALGISIAEVIPTNNGGSLKRYRHFNTFQQENRHFFDSAAQFLREVTPGNIVLAVVGIGSGEATLPDNIKNELLALGSKQAQTQDFFIANWAFAAKKGSPETAVEEYSQNNRGVTLNAFIPTPDGDVYSAIATLSGEPGEDVYVANADRPGLHYHAADSLLVASNQADLIIISHPLFIQEAHRLANYRRDHDGYTTRVVDIYRIYDEFSEGNKESVAIRRFLQYADTNWADPKPAFVILFGDASWDPRKQGPGSVMTDYIPSFGNPVTDYLYTVAFGDSLFAPRQFIGRLPAISTTDARNMVDKLIEYDDLPPAFWNKRFIFMSGGLDVGERDRLLRDNIDLAKEYVLSPEFMGDTTIIYRMGTNEDLMFPSAREAEWARREINKGALLVDFTGHGSTTNLDLNYGYPEDFDNENRYFVLSTFSCQTGAFADPQLSLRNEDFVRIERKGAIAAIGGTGFSYTDIDNNIKEKMLNHMTRQEYERQIGPAFTLAKHMMFMEYAYPPPPLGFSFLDSVRARNHLMMYHMLGDPTTKLGMRTTVELALIQEGTSLVNEEGREPDLSDTVVIVNARLWNFGKPIDLSSADTAIAIRATIIDRAGTEISSVDTIYNLAKNSPIQFRLPLTGEPGEYTIRLLADPQEQVAESYREDNQLLLTLLLRGNQLLPLEPIPYGVVEGYDNVVIRLLNPPTGAGAIITIDTTEAFTSPSLFTSQGNGTMASDELVTSWTFSIPLQLRSVSKFWWKAVATSGDPVLAEKFPIIETFTVTDGGISPDQYILGGVNQMKRAKLAQLVNSEEGVGPGTRQVPVEIRAVGQSFIDFPTPNTIEVPGSRLGIKVDGKEYRPNAVSGLNILVLPENDIVPIADTLFVFSTQNSVPAFLNFVNAILPGQRVLIGTSGVSFFFQGDTLNEKAVKNALKVLGSTIADSLGVEDTYILIGGKQLPPEQVVEVRIDAAAMRAKGEVPPFADTLRAQLSAIPKAGTALSPVAGPATAWRTVAYNLAPESDAPLAVTVYGVRQDGLRDSVLSGTVTPTMPQLDISAVDVLQYPRLELRHQFANDTTQRLRVVGIDFDPSPELAIVPSTFGLRPDSVLQGDRATVVATIRNLSRHLAAENFSVRLFTNGEVQAVPTDSALINRINPLDSQIVQLNITTDRISGERTFSAIVNPYDIPAEPYTQNNRMITGPLKVSGDAIPPGIAIYADNARMMNGDYVQPQPEFEVRIFDNSLLKLDTTSTLTMIIDNQWITAPTLATLNYVNDGEYRAQFLYKPAEPLENGDHDMLIFVRDASGNSDTSEIITFRVERAFQLLRVANYPNPFEKETMFTFMVSGNTPPTSGEVAIFTVAGRKIKTITLGPGDLNVGYNRVEWDGLDEDRDRLANGVYLYRLTVETEEGKQHAIDKIVVMR